MEKQNLYIFNFSVFLFKILIFVLGIGVLFNYVFEEYVIFNNQIGGASKINKILTETPVDEIPIFGSSRAQGNFIPSIIDENCFNYGIDGAQANIWLFFLEQELKEEKDTPILINFDLRGLVYKDGDICNYIPHWYDTKDIITLNGEFYYNIPFFKYYGQYEKYFKDYLKEKINVTKKTDKGGSFEKNKLIDSKFNKLVIDRLNTITTFMLDGKLNTKFNRLIENTTRPIVLVVSPYHSSFFNKFGNIEEVNEYLKNLSKRENIYIIDMRSYIKENDLFVNTTHLNYEGAIVFSTKLKEDLTTLAIIK